MTCDICGRQFGGKPTFATLFLPPRFCPSCRRAYTPSRCEAAIPIDGGLVRYVWVFPGANDDHHLQVLLADALAPLFVEAETWDRAGAVVVVLGLAEAAAFPAWFPSIAAFRDVRLISLFFFDPERLGMEF